MTMWLANKSQGVVWPFYFDVNNRCYCLALGLSNPPNSNFHTDGASCVLSAQEIFQHFQVCVNSVYECGGFVCAALYAIFCIRRHEDIRYMNFCNKPI